MSSLSSLPSRLSRRLFPRWYATSLRRITSVEELKKYLHVAVQLEHAAIPPYLTALSSLHPSTNAEACRVLRAVIGQALRHVMLAANLLNAVGGTPDLSQPGFVPSYPAHWPDGGADLELGLLPFSKAAVESFLKLARSARPEQDGPRLVKRQRSWRAVLPVVRVDDKDEELHFYSIGAFYQEIDRGLSLLQEDLAGRRRTLFVGDPSWQVGAECYDLSGRAVRPVVDLASAQDAIRSICQQGRGFGGRLCDAEGELFSHDRFQQLIVGRYYRAGDAPNQPSGDLLSVDWDAVYPLKLYAQLSDYPQGSELRALAVEFSRAYQEFLGLLTRALCGQPGLLVGALDDRSRLEALALKLGRNPLPDQNGVHAAPVYVSPKESLP